MANYSKPKFITFEGIVGSGKTTQCRMLYEYLSKKGVDTLRTREIGGTEVAEAIRDLLIYQEMLPMSELLLVMAARYEHLHKIIMPAMKNGQWIVCDRFFDSTACYQGLHPDIGLDKVYQLHNQIFGNLVPDITFFIDVPAEEAMSRIADFHQASNKFERKTIDFHEKISEGFKKVANKFNDRIVGVKAAGLTAEAVHDMVVKHLTEISDLR